MTCNGLGGLLEIAQHRICTECGEEFESNSSASALEQFADHVAIHQPTVAQWSNAYGIIMRMRKTA